jgi:hypothetical protein
MSHQCSTCNEVFNNGIDFQEHGCVAEAMKLPREELLKRMLKSGAIDEDYYQKEMNKPN